MNETKTEHDINTLNTLYTDAESADQEVFAEQRSNILLISGEHYNRRQSSFHKRIRDSKELSQEQKLRLTKNHIQKITKTYVNNILSLAPGVGFEAKNEAEVQDQKAAKLHHAVWQDACQKYKIESELIDDWCDDFVGIGEVAVKIFWDPTLGSIRGYEQLISEDGQPAVDATGQPIHDENLPVFTGAFVFENIYGFNLRRDANAKDMRQSPWMGLQKMVDKATLLRRWPDKKKMITESTDETYMVFDSARGGYGRAKGQVLLRETYMRVCPEYPQGQYFFHTKDGILEQGPLPGGIFPIIFQAFDKVQTTPRGRSAVKIMRPYQAEINRAASKIAEHQVTLGDDKILIQNGTKISAGVALPGVRSINYTGITPEILAGRDGSQYLEYMKAQIEELYMVMNVAEDSAEKEGQLDPFVMLFRAASQKKKFQRYTKRFENFLIEICKTYLALAKIHLDDDALTNAIGKIEGVNIPEFRMYPETCYQIIVEAQSDDIETKMGKQLCLTQALQYVGSRLNPEDIGKFMRQMPYANFDASFDDMTISYDASTNDILALDRGEMPAMNVYDDHVYSVKRLVARMRQADFKHLPPQIQQNYALIVDMHEQYEADRQLAIQRAKDGFIPTNGYLVACDFYVEDPADKTGTKTRRARLPYESLQWLIQQLEVQGQGLDSLEAMNEGAQGQIAQKMTSQRPTPTHGMVGGPQQGTGMPTGVANGGTGNSSWSGV